MTRFFYGGPDVRQNRMEVHKETQTFASLPQTAKISLSISSITLVMIFFLIRTTHAICHMSGNDSTHPTLQQNGWLCVVCRTICVICRMSQDFDRNRSSGNQGLGMLELDLSRVFRHRGSKHGLDSCSATSVFKMRVLPQKNRVGSRSAELKNYRQEFKKNYNFNF